MAIVSFSRRFIFLKTRKTAGTSVQESLLPLCAPGDVATLVWTNVLDGSRCPIQEFPTLDEIEQAYAVNREDFYRFGFTRNPYALVLSRYFYQVKMGRLAGEATRDGFNRWLQEVYFVGEPGFPGGRYLKDRTRLLLFDAQLRPQVDFIGRFEQLDEDFARVLQRLGAGDQAPLAHVNQSNRAQVNYRDWMEPAGRRLVEAHFDFELEYFQYQY